MKPIERHIWNEGTSKQQRQNQVLTQPNFKVDERFFETFIKEIAEYSEHLKFFRPEDVASGNVPNNWRGLLETDEIVILSLVSLLNTKEIENQFYRHYNIGKSNITTRNSQKHLVLAMLETNKIGLPFLKWHSLLSKIDPVEPHYPIYKEWDMALKSLIDIELNVPENETQGSSDVSLKAIMVYLKDWEEEPKKISVLFLFGQSRIWKRTLKIC